MPFSVVDEAIYSPDNQAEPCNIHLEVRVAGCALVLDALEQVATRRDRAILLEVRVQMASGDPSAALTLARRHGLTPEVVLQVVCRVRARLNRLAACDDRFAPLAHGAPECGRPVWMGGGRGGWAGEPASMEQHRSR